LKSADYTEAEADGRLKGAPKMYIPRAFNEADPAYIRNFIRQNGFAALISSGNSRLEASHLLLNLKEAGSSSMLLNGHMARANQQWRTFQPTQEVLAIFSGPHTYVSAGWYSIKSAPTWNYVSVHVYGTPRIIEDRAELYDLLKCLVDWQEQHNPEGDRYRIEGLPKDILENMMNIIVGFEITVTRIEAAAKLSQNRNSKDYQNIIQKLNERGDCKSAEVAKEMLLRKRENDSE
jgi:transcriptional regulator